MLVFIFPLLGLSDEQQRIVNDYAWIQTREHQLHVRSLKLENGNLQIELNVHFEHSKEIYQEILRRLNIIIQDKLGPSVPLLNTDLTAADYAQRITVPVGPWHRRKRSATSEAATAASAPSHLPLISSLRFDPVSDQQFDYLSEKLTTGYDAYKFALEQNDKRLKVTMVAPDVREMGKLKRILEERMENCRAFST